MSSDLPARITLTADIGIDRASYEALELAMVTLLEDEEHTLTMRLLAVHSLVSGAVAQYGRGSRAVTSFSEWVGHMNSSVGRRWIHSEAANWGKGREGRLRLAIAPLIAAVETRLSDAAGYPCTQKAFPMASGIAKGRGVFHLSSLSREVRLEEMSEVRLDQDSQALSPVMVDALVSWLRGRLLLRHPSVLKRTQHFLMCSALARWYSAATTIAAGRSEVGRGELATAIAIVEREYIRESPLPTFLADRLGLAELFGMLTDLLVSPSDLALNPYTLTTRGLHSVV